MCSGQVKPMLADVVQANTHINALIGFVVVQLYRLEGSPMPQQSHKFEFSGRGRDRGLSRSVYHLRLGECYRYRVLMPRRPAAPEAGRVTMSWAS